MPYYVLIFDRSFGFESVKVVEATMCGEEAESTVFRQGERMVYRVPTHYLVSYTPHATHLEATDAAAAYRARRAGAATFHVDEASAVKAEGVRGPAAFTERVGIVFSGGSKPKT